MRAFREPESDDGRNALTFALGAVGGLAIGMLLSRHAPTERVTRLSSGIRERATRVVRRLRPARLQRMAVEQEELTMLEDRVLDAFIADQVMSERGVDVGAISQGIIELSGSVWTQEEADHAVHIANSVEGVLTVVNRLDVESEAKYLARHADSIPDSDDDDDAYEGSEWTGRMVGMNRPRQGRQTEPRQRDDSQPQRSKALRDADLDQYEDEDIAYGQPRVGERPGTGDPWQLNYDEDELDNQDPQGKDAADSLDDPLNARGEAAKSEGSGD